MKNIKANIWIKIFVTSGMLAYLMYILDWHRVRELNTYALVVLLLGVLVTLVFLLFMAMRWKLLIQMNIEKKFHLKTTYTLYLIGFFFNVFLPGAIGGDVMRAKYSSEYCQIKLKDAGFIVASERLFGLLSILILFASGVFFNTGMLPKLGINNLFWYTPTLVIIVMCAIYWVSRQIIIKRGMFLPVLILSGIAQLADIIIVFLYSTYFNLGLSIGNLLVVMPLVYIATILPISLGGLGVREGALVGLMALFQVDVSTAVIISFMLYLTKVAVGIIGMPVFIKTKAYHSL